MLLGPSRRAPRPPRWSGSFALPSAVPPTPTRAIPTASYTLHLAHCHHRGHPAHTTLPHTMRARPPNVVTRGPMEARAAAAAGRRRAPSPQPPPLAHPCAPSPHAARASATPRSLVSRHVDAVRASPRRLGMRARRRRAPERSVAPPPPPPRARLGPRGKPGCTPLAWPRRGVAAVAGAGRGLAPVVAWRRSWPGAGRRSDPSCPDLTAPLRSSHSLASPPAVPLTPGVLTHLPGARVLAGRPIWTRTVRVVHPD